MRQRTPNPSAAEEAIMARHLFRAFGAVALLVSLSACVGPGRHYDRGHAYHSGYGQQRNFSAYQPSYGRGGFYREPSQRGGFHPGN
jgi:hypothetical protein